MELRNRRGLNAGRQERDVYMRLREKKQGAEYT